MALIVHLVVLAFVTLVVLGAVIFVVIDMFGRVDYLKHQTPWLERILERRSAVGVLLLVAIFLILGDSYELVKKELPEVPSPPKVEIKAPPAPKIQDQPSVMSRK